MAGTRLCSGFLEADRADYQLSRPDATASLHTRLDERDSDGNDGYVPTSPQHAPAGVGQATLL